MRTKEAILNDFDYPCDADIPDENVDSRTNTVRDRAFLEALLDMRDGLKLVHSGETVTFIGITSVRESSTTVHTVFYYNSDGALGSDSNLANFTGVA